MKIIKLIPILFLLMTLCSFVKNTGFSPEFSGKIITDFSLKNIDGKDVSLEQFKNANGFIVVFTCNHCPFARLYTQRLNALNKKFTPLGFPLLAVNSMDSVVYEEESFVLMQQKALNERFNFPYLQDGCQTVGKNFGADQTPHAFIIAKENNQWIVKYSGGIDDNGEHPEKAKPFVEKALEEILAFKPVTQPENKSIGCQIHYRK